MLPWWCSAHFICLLAIPILSLMKWLFIFFAHFLMMLLCSQYWAVRIICIFQIQAIYKICVSQVLSHRPLVTFLFFLIVYFEVKEFWILARFSLSIIFFLLWTMHLISYLSNICLIRSQRYSSMFSFKSLF